MWLRHLNYWTERGKSSNSSKRRSERAQMGEVRTIRLIGNRAAGQAWNYGEYSHVSVWLLSEPAAASQSQSQLLLLGDTATVSVRFGSVSVIWRLAPSVRTGNCNGGATACQSASSSAAQLCSLCNYWWPMWQYSHIGMKSWRTCRTRPPVSLRLIDWRSLSSFFASAYTHTHCLLTYTYTYSVYVCVHLDNRNYGPLNSFLVLVTVKWHRFTNSFSPFKPLCVALRFHRPFLLCSYPSYTLHTHTRSVCVTVLLIVIACERWLKQCILLVSPYLRSQITRVNNAGFCFAS